MGGRVVKEGLATSAPSGGKVNAVEEQKGRMKRESLLARKEKGSLGAGDERSVETGKRWFAGLSAGMGRVVRGAEPVVLVTKKTSLGDLTNRAPSPTHPPSPVADSFRTPTRPRSMSPPRTPTSLRSSVSISALRDGKSKRAEAAQIGLGRSPTKQRAKSTVQATPDGASYSSLRDVRALLLSLSFFLLTPGATTDARILGFCRHARHHAHPTSPSHPPSLTDSTPALLPPVPLLPLNPLGSSRPLPPFFSVTPSPPSLHLPQRIPLPCPPLGPRRRLLSRRPSSSPPLLSSSNPLSTTPSTLALTAQILGPVIDAHQRSTIPPTRRFGP